METKQEIQQEDLNELALPALKNFKTTPTLVAEALRNGILKGVIRSGQTLRQEELAATFGVSRIPVREAFRQLEAEGLIKIYPHRGAVVSSLSAFEVQELFEIRVPLETTALRLAIPHMTALDLQKAARILDLADREEAGGRASGRWGELNWDFHAALYAPAARPRLLAMLVNLEQNVDRYMRLVLTGLDYQQHSQAEHRELLAACRAKEVEKAVALLTGHIEAAGQKLTVYLRQSEEPGPV
jgi:DNA-binding GntR family transcriptional regulator